MGFELQSLGTQAYERPGQPHVGEGLLRSKCAMVPTATKRMCLSKLSAARGRRREARVPSKME